MTTRGRRSESFLQENFPATHHISCRNIPSRMEHPVMPPAPFPSAHPVSRQTSCRAPSIQLRASSSRQPSCRAPSIQLHASSSRQPSRYVLRIQSCGKHPVDIVHPSPHIQFAANILSTTEHSSCCNIASSTENPVYRLTPRRIRSRFEHSIASTKHVTISRRFDARCDHVAFWCLLVQYTPRR